MILNYLENILSCINNVHPNPVKFDTTSLIKGVFSSHPVNLKSVKGF